MHIFIPKNIKGRDFVVGDIHGHYDLLKTELKTVGFDKQKDRLCLWIEMSRLLSKPKI